MGLARREKSFCFEVILWPYERDQPHCGRSPVAAEMFLPNIYIDEPIQLSLFSSAETVTVTVVPAFAAVRLIGATKKTVGLPIRLINRKSIR